MPELTRRQRSVLAVLLLLAVMGLFFEAVIHPAWRSYQDNREQIALDREQLVRFRELAASLETHRQKLERMEQQRTASRLTLAGESSTLAAAGLQDRINQVANSHGADLVSTRIQPARQEGEFLRLTVKVSLRVSIGILQKFLYELESGPPLIVIEHILIQASQPVRRGDQQGGDREPTLVVQMDLAGFMHSPENQGNGNE